MPCSFAGSLGHVPLAFQVPVHTRFSQMGRKVQCHLGEKSRASALPAIQGLCHMDAHTGACTHLHIHIHIYVYTPTYAHTHPPHIYTHMCMHTHTQTLAHTCTCPHMHTYPHIETGGCAQSGLRGWEPLVSQCVHCFSFLLGFLHRSQMSV